MIRFVLQAWEVAMAPIERWWPLLLGLWGMVYVIVAVQKTF